MVGVVRNHTLASVGLKEGLVVDMAERWVEGMVDMADMVVVVVAIVVMETLEEVMMEVLQDFTLGMVDMVMVLGLVDLCIGQVYPEALAMWLLVAMVVPLGMLAVEDIQAVIVAGMVGLKALYLAMLKDMVLVVAPEVPKHMRMVVLQADGFIPIRSETLLTSLELQLLCLLLAGAS